MKRRAVALTLLAAVLAISSARQAQGASLDPLLLPVLSGDSAPQALGLGVVGVAPDGTGEPLISVSVRFTGSLETLRSLGIRISGVLGDVATAEVSPAQLRILAVHPAVQSIEAAKYLRPHLDVSELGQHTAVRLLRTQAGDGWTDTSYTGRGVLIGIIDTGVDLAHGDFLKPDGSTRVLSVWDQSSAVGRSPRGFSYGAECTAAQIDARDCPQVDRDGHGTHVAGIAAGDGSATGGGQNAYRFVGMAPQADLLVVKLGDTASTRVIDALSYLKSKATSLRRPIVVNLSFGSTLGPHDGTSDFERAVDVFTGPDAVPGAVVVVSGGNSGHALVVSTDSSGRLTGIAPGNPLHAVGCFQTGTACPAGPTVFSSGSPAVASFVVPNRTTRVVLETWYSGASELGVAVNGPSGCAAGPGSLSQEAVVVTSTSCATIVIAAGDAHPANGDRRTAVVLTHPSEIAPGIWSLVITGTSLHPTDPTRFDVWTAAEPTANLPSFNTLSSAQTTIETPASATEALAVAPYISKPSWVTIDGNCGGGGINTLFNALAPYASRGPLRPCSSCVTQPQKPDVAAPGFVVMSSLSSRLPGADKLFCKLDADRRHYALDGSSMAAPHVTGAAALLLQVNANLTARQVKAYLLGNTSLPRPTPIEQWGQGRLNIKAAVDALRAAGDDPAPTAPSGVRVTSVHSQRVALAWDIGADLDLRAFTVYRRAETDLVDVAIAQDLAPTTTAFEDSPDPLGLRGVLTNETAYIYSVEAVDIGGQPSPRSSEVRAVPTAGESSVGLCFIATAAYGSAWHPHVVSLRTFRDRHLRPHGVGRAVIAAYETLSPPIARFIAPSPTLRAAARGALTPVVLAIEHPTTTAVVVALGLLGALGLVFRRRAA